MAPGRRAKLPILSCLFLYIGEIPAEGRTAIAATQKPTSRRDDAVVDSGCDVKGEGDTDCNHDNLRLTMSRTPLW